MGRREEGGGRRREGGKEEEGGRKEVIAGQVIDGQVNLSVHLPQCSGA